LPPIILGKLATAGTDDNSPLSLSHPPSHLSVVILVFGARSFYIYKEASVLNRNLVEL
jgi:hypothetical protein